MLPPYYMVICASICIIPVLFAGAVIDFQSRKFPKTLWNVPSKIAGFFTIMMYLMLFANREYQMVGILLTISIVLAITFYVITIRLGQGGGDYRALAYIAILTPTMAVNVTLISLVFIIIGLVIKQVAKLDTPEYKENINNLTFFGITFRSKGGPAQWAVGIFLAFTIVFIHNLITGF